ncbi:MAG: glycosyltransferase family 2 protein [Pseudomonadota bacterium]
MSQPSSPLGFDEASAPYNWAIGQTPVVPAKPSVAPPRSASENLGALTLKHRPIDPTAAGVAEPEAAIAGDFVPWLRMSNILIVAVQDEAAERAARAHLEPRWGGPIIPSYTDLATLREGQFRAYGERLAEKAANLCPDEMSCRFLGERRKQWYLRSLPFVLLVGIFLFPATMLSALIAWFIFMNAVMVGMRLIALTADTRHTFAPLDRAPADLPIISVLLPTYREASVLKALINALGQVDYPRDRLDLKLLLEEDDLETKTALTQISDAAKVDLDIITVPRGAPQTKPRAMNYALPFCKGSVIGIYDAEDHPAPDQLQIVARALSAAPKKIACVQAILDFYNHTQNWLTRCFSLEYAIWFRVLLHGVRKMGLPLPLGGTSVFFRRDVLEEIGAWDAHNVTEDADLGMRLARFGYSCELIPSTTLEEANSHYGNWIGQRSRWLKGYVVTWLTHMRQPRQLLRDLGLRGFLGFQLLLLGGVTTYIALPFHLVWLGLVLGDVAPGVFSQLPQDLWVVFFITLPIGNLVMVSAAFLAAYRLQRTHLYLWVFTLPVYWLLGAIAAYRAVTELFHIPFHWHKTQHGLTQEQPPSVPSP